MNTTTIHPAEVYLRNPNNPSSLYVKINGKRRRLFINRQEGVIGIIAERKKRRGYKFYDWASIQDVYYPTGKDEKETVRKEVLKYKKLARLATHTNAWLRQIADADPEKSLYENHITTGTTIDGKCIRLNTIEKYCGCMVMEASGKPSRKRRSIQATGLTFVAMTVHSGVNPVRTVTWQQAL